MGFDINDINNFDQFGQYLKYVREQRQISFEQIHKETKIRTRYLVAMENGDFDSIPGGDVYVKGFLRSYARCVGLEPASIIELYKKLKGETKEEEVLAKPSPQTEFQLNDILNNVRSFVWQNYRKVCITLLAASFVILLGISIKTLVRNNISENQGPPKSEVPAIQTPTKEHAEETEEEPVMPESKKVTIEVIEDTGQNTIYLIDDDYIEVTINNITDRCWIQVYRDDDRDFEGILISGDSKTWKANNMVKIRIGNPGAVNLVVNGEDLGCPGGMARDFIFNRRG